MKNLMQTIFATGMIFLFAFSFGQAQESGIKINNAQPTHLDFFFSGVETTLNRGDMNSAVKDFKKNVQGVQIGLSLQAGISKAFSIVPEFTLGMKGGKLKENNPITDAESTLRFYDIEIPVLARLHVGQLHLNAGPSAAYTFYGSQKLDGSRTDLDFTNSAGGYRRLEGGIQFGGGYTFSGKKNRAVLDVRYCLGLTNISRDKEIYNRSLVIRLHMSKNK